MPGVVHSPGDTYAPELRKYLGSTETDTALLCTNDIQGFLGDIPVWMMLSLAGTQIFLMGY